MPTRKSLPVVTWEDHVRKWKDCAACPLSSQRFRICLARGTVPCDVLFVGEAPGEVENVMGRPFVGPAGRLLDQIIERAMPATVTYALTNLVCCFPARAKAGGDGQPSPEEIRACEPRLIELVNLMRPKLLVCVGVLSKEWIDHNDTVPCADIDHPAYLLRMPLAQKQMAVQRCIVQLRKAVDDMPRDREFTKWENGGYANLTPKQRKRADYDRFFVAPPDDIYTGDDIPF